MKELFIQIVNMSITASWLVLVIALIRLVFKKAPKSMICFLWLFVAIRLIVPFSFESALSLIPSTQVIPDEIIEVTPNPSVNVQLPLNGLGNETQIVIPNQDTNSNVSNPSVEQNVPVQNEIQWLEILPWCWICGILMMAGYAAYSYQKIVRQVQISINKEENIWICDDLSSPFILGVLNPRIYVPSYLSETEIKYVLAHEKAHLRRFDHLWKPLGYSLLSVYWFNPVIWAAYILLCSDIELACDEKVIKTLGDDNKIEYSRTLLSCSVPRNMILACPLAFGEVSVKQRVKSVLNYKKPAFWVLVVALVICLCIPVFFLSDSEEPFPGTLTVQQLKDDQKSFELTLPEDMELIYEMTLMEYEKDNWGTMQFEYRFEVQGSIYEVNTEENYIRVRKDDQYYSIVKDAELVNLYRGLFGELPLFKENQPVSFDYETKTAEVCLEDHETGLKWRLGNMWVDSIRNIFEVEGISYVDIDQQYYLDKQKAMNQNNSVQYTVTLYNIYGEEQISFDLYESLDLVSVDGRIALVDGRSFKFIDSLEESDMTKWVYDPARFIKRGSEQSDYPLEISIVPARLPYETVYPVFELTVQNHSDHRLQVLNISAAENDRNMMNDFGSFYSFVVEPNETKILYLESYTRDTELTGTMAANYQYYDYDLGQEISVTNSFSEQAYPSLYREPSLTIEGRTYYVDTASWTFGYINVIEICDDPVFANGYGECTLADMMINSYYGASESTLWNIVETSVPLTQELKSEILETAETLNCDVVFNGDFNYDEASEKYTSVQTVTLQKGNLNGYSALSGDTVYPITDEMRERALSMAISLEEFAKFYEERPGLVVGVDGYELANSDKEIIESLTNNRYIISYTNEDIFGLGAEKPVIYLYSDEDMNVCVNTAKETTLTYPEIGDGWDVELKDNRMYVDGKEIRALYYEAWIPNVFDTSEGFVVHKEDAASFLEEKLAYMGLTELEIYDFIVYWLPIIHQNEYTLITFQNEVFAKLYPLEISVKPDTELRIYMVIQGLDEPIDVKEQILPKGPERSGFTLVEWGGSVLE
ncbi:MAG: hypothetical protein J6K75_01120 [Erysipelotrichaceae bacterium]|nr:hypothetical protein [Erysipelotrichaceae bacterium]